MTDSKKTIFHSAKNFFSGTMLSRISGLARDIVMAFAFGTRETVAAFFIAFRLAHLLRRLFGEGAMQTAFIPKFEELRTKSETRAFQFFKDLSVIMTIIIVAVIALMAGIITLFNNGNEVLTLTTYMLPSLLFISLYGLNSALLQCEKKYFITSVAPVFFNIFWILGALIIYFFKLNNPMYWLSFFVIISCFSQWIATVPSIVKIYRSKNISVFHVYFEDFLQLLRPLTLGVFGVAATQINNALDVIFAKLASPEGPALLWYSVRLQQVPIALFGISLMQALLPPLSRAAKNNDIKKFKSFLNYGTSRCLYIMVPVTLITIFFGRDIITLFYARGAFNIESVDRTSLCLLGYSFGIIPISLIVLWAASFYSRGNYKTPALASFFSMLLNIALNSIFVLALGYGAASVAFATSIAAWFNFAFLFLAARKEFTFDKTELIISSKQGVIR